MQSPCERCGGSGKVPIYYNGVRTKRLRACPECEGVPFREQDGAFADRPVDSLYGANRTTIPTLDETEQTGVVKPDSLFDDPEAL